MSASDEDSEYPETTLDPPNLARRADSADAGEPETELDPGRFDDAPPPVPRVQGIPKEVRRRPEIEEAPRRPAEAVGRRPRAAAPVPRGPADPKADAMLYVALGVVALLILLLSVGIAIGLSGGFE